MGKVDKLMGGKRKNLKEVKEWIRFSKRGNKRKTILEKGVKPGK